MSKSAKAWLFAAVLLSSCERPAPRAAPQAVHERHDFTDEDRRVARALSLGAYQTSVATSPFEKDVLCEVGLVKIRERLSVSQDQHTLINSARAIFLERQVKANVSETERAAVRARLEQSVQTESEWGRIVIGCLRGLN